MHSRKSAKSIEEKVLFVTSFTMRPKWRTLWPFLLPPEQMDVGSVDARHWLLPPPCDQPWQHLQTLSILSEWPIYIVFMHSPKSRIPSTLTPCLANQSHSALFLAATTFRQHVEICIIDVICWEYLQCWLMVCMTSAQHFCLASWPSNNQTLHSGSPNPCFWTGICVSPFGWGNCWGTQACAVSCEIKEGKKSSAIRMNVGIWMFFGWNGGGIGTLLELYTPYGWKPLFSHFPDITIILHPFWVHHPESSCPNPEVWVQVWADRSGSLYPSFFFRQTLFPHSWIS